MRTRIVFFVPLPHRSLRVNSRTQITAWRAALVREYGEQVWCAGWSALPVTRCAMFHGPMRCPDDLPWSHAVLRLEWRHAGVAPDQDNTLASLKSLIDVLHCKSNRPLGIVVDDSPEHLRVEPVELVKVKHRRDEGVLVTVERLP